VRNDKLNQLREQIRRRRPIGLPPLLAAAILLGCQEQKSGINEVSGTRLPRHEISQSRCVDCNVVLITIDTLRADHLSIYGYHRETTPEMDAFGRSGLVFERAVAQSCWTTPSMLSMMTSKYVSRLTFDRTTQEYLDPRLAELFSDAGYATAAFVAHPALAGGYEQGFDVYDQSAATPKDTVSSEGVTTAALRWVEEIGDRKFFLWVHYFDPHNDYVPPPPFDEMYTGGYEGKLEKGFHMGRARRSFRTDKLTKADVDFVMGLYDGEVSFTDSHIGRLLDALEADGRAGNIVAIGSDHGEEFGERDTIGQHRTTVHAEQVHTPLLLRFPGVQPGRTSEWAANLDIAPTLLDLAGLEVPENFEGQNLLDDKGRPILAECDYVKRDGKRRYPKKVAALYDGNVKVMHHFHDGWTRVFDGLEDPTELRDLSAESPELTTEYRERLLEIVLSDEKAQAYYGDIEAPMIDDETRKKLEALGYVM